MQMFDINTRIKEHQISWIKQVEGWEFHYPMNTVWKTTPKEGQTMGGHT